MRPWHGIYIDDEVIEKSFPAVIDDEGIASMEGGGRYNPTDAEGYWRIQGLPGRVQGRINRRHN